MTGLRPGVFFEALLADLICTEEGFLASVELTSLENNLPPTPVTFRYLRVRCALRSIGYGELNNYNLIFTRN